MREEWHSDLVLGRLDPLTFAQLGPVRKLDLSPVFASGAPGPWTPCRPQEVYVAANKTISAKFSSGPEDPRLFDAFGKLWCTFESLPPGPTDPTDFCPSAARMFWSRLVH